MKVKYIADDGTIFDTPEACQEHENKVNKAETEDVKLLNGICRFFDSSGREIHLTTMFEEGQIYGLRIDAVRLTHDQIPDVMQAFGRHFDDLYYALEASSFQDDGEVTLVYDWTGNSNGWREIDYEKKEFLLFVKKVLNW